MSLSKIKATLIKSYVDSSFGISTAYENRKFTPVVGTPWAAVYILPNQPSVFSLGANGSDEHDGVMQVSLFYPLDKGDGDLLAMADSMRAVYSHGVSFTHNGQAVSIRQCGRRGGRTEEGYFTDVLNINWTARTLRGA